MLKRQKNGLEIWIDTCHQNLVTIYLTVSENVYITYTLVYFIQRKKTTSTKTPTLLLLNLSLF